MTGASSLRGLQVPMYLEPAVALALYDPYAVRPQIRHVQHASLALDHLMDMRRILTLGVGRRPVFVDVRELEQR